MSQNIDQESRASSGPLVEVWRELRSIKRSVERLEAKLSRRSVDTNDEALSAKDAALLLGISVRTLRRHAGLGNIRPIRLGGRITYTRQAVEAFQRLAANGKVSVPVEGRVTK